MRFTTSLRLWVCAVAVSVCNAQISKPRAGDVLMPNQQFEVEWQTAGLQAPINVDLVPSGKTDLSVIAEKIAVQVDNVGRLNWNPSASITAFESFAIVITDSAQAVVVSEPFKITQLTQQPVVQTILGADPAQVEILTAAAGHPKVVYSGALPAEAIPAGVAEAEAAPTEPALVQPEESRNTISNGTAPGASPSRQRTGKSKKQPATPNEDAVPRNSSKPLTSIAEKNQTPTPIYSTIQSAPSAPASFPTLSATKNQTGVPGRGAEVTPTPIYSTIPDSGPAFPSLSVTKNQTAPANAEVTPTPIYSTLPDTLSKFPTLAPTNNQTAPSAEQPAKSKAPAATQPAIEVPANRTSITPEAPTTPSLPIVTLPVPKNSTIPASPPATSAPPVLPSAANPASNSSATPTGLPALPVTEPAAVAPVPIAAPSAPSSPPSDGTGTAVTKPEPQTSDPAAAAPSAASSSGALPYKGTLPADGGAVKSDVPASTTGGPTDTASGVSVTPVPSTTAGGGKESEKGGDKSGDESGGSGSGSGKGSGQDSDTESDSESGSGSGSSSISGSNTGVRQPSTSVSSTAAIVPTPQPQLGVGIGATPVVQIGPSITLPSSLWTSMILETAAGFAAPSGGSFAVATSPALLTVPNAGCRTTKGGGYVAAVLGAVTALLVVVM
ncbi:uncharacterized protein CCOS01_04635 [Colletotrichum costaricense]|uniref:Uncharacterized protein n=1 Tax=Colletotrichum costaricense TaxID=1209916 RepID=A0AAJ0E343_9PEZI|nr:uncharacterized protein CCOS01_04635 [Colletotrichum costaricense]KAK1532652.1 hypothetical protein CCOS01_04635 [Colletotrichum costaricense]